MAKASALIVDDEVDIRQLLKITLQQMQLDVIDVENYAGAIHALGQHEFDLCFTDMRLPDGNGLDIVKYIQQEHAHIPVAVITAYGNAELAVSALKAGAFDFVSKPVNLKILRELIQQALRLSHDKKPLQLNQFGLYGETESMRRLAEKIQKLARSQAPIYISGESGTGKELVARLIHQLGPRAEGAFVPVNCGAIPENLMESEFFGHKKGSFTGAVADKQGLFQAANSGTLFLDEVADLPIAMQVKLLRAIQEKAIRPIGSQHEVAVDVRVLSATHKNLHALVKQGSFRQDLFYRINVIEVHVPSLRERREDIPLLAEQLLASLALQVGGDIPKLADAALQALQGYAFPGNVRELENILERAMTLCENNTIQVSDLHLLDSADMEPQSTADIANADMTIATDKENVSLGNYLDNIEKKRIIEALQKTHGNKTKAARLLGISFRALRYRLKKLSLE